jgi:hypothetical protein
LDDFEIWLKVQRSRISAKSRLGEKLSYIAKYMGSPKLFLDDGSVEMDSNIVERAIRPIALNRKNALFAGHDLGPHYVSYRDLQAERRRAIRLPQGNTRSHRRWLSIHPH